MDIKTKLTMLRACAATVITEMEGSRNLGVAIIKNFMRLGCAKIATLTIITEKEESSLEKYMEKKKNNQV